MLGSFMLGAGFYGAWVAAEAVSGSAALMAGGALCVALSVWLGSRRVAEVRVGELGVIYGDPAEVPRLHWCDVRAVRLSAERLELDAQGGKGVSIPLPAYGAAAARIVAEASQRIPDRVDVAPKAHERLPPLREEDGERVAAARLQLAGRKCTASGKSITFESDARLCESCAALYHVSSVPDVCASCRRPLGSAAAARAAG